MLERARQEEIVCGGKADGDAHARAVHVLHRLQWRVRTDHVGAFDQHVRRREFDLRGAHRLDRDEQHVDLVLLRGFECLPGRRKGHELERHAEASGKLARQIGRNPARLAVCTFLRQHAVAVVDGGAQLPGRRELFQRIGRRLCGGCLHGKRERGGEHDADHRRPLARSLARRMHRAQAPPAQGHACKNGRRARRAPAVRLNAGITEPEFRRSPPCWARAPAGSCRGCGSRKGRPSSALPASRRPEAPTLAWCPARGRPALR